MYLSGGRKKTTLFNGWMNCVKTSPQYTFGSSLLKHALRFPRAREGDSLCRTRLSFYDLHPQIEPSARKGFFGDEFRDRPAREKDALLNFGVSLGVFNIPDNMDS